jgi:hypothetical protein
MYTFESLESVIAYVQKIRDADGIRELGRNWQSEISSQTYHGGEIALLVECQLAKTEFGFGAWRELKDPHILRAVKEYVRGESAAC